MRSTPGVILAILILVAGCSPSASPPASIPIVSGSPTPTEIPSTATQTEIPSSPTPSPSRAPVPRPSLVPAGALAWEPIATEGGNLRSLRIRAAVSFRDSYLVLGSDADLLDWVVRSMDGRHWEATQIGAMVQQCPGYTPGHDSSVYKIATDGNQVVLAGIEYTMDPNACDTFQAMTWVSTDGRTWKRSKLFGAMAGYAEADDVWPIPGGWEVLVNANLDGPRSIWRSSDGLAWQQVHVVEPGAFPGLSVTIGASTDGIRLLSRFNPQGTADNIDGLGVGESRLETSSDAVDWSTLDPVMPIGRGLDPGGIVGPGPVGPPMWLLVVGPEAGEPTLTYTSLDLKRWDKGTFPGNELDDLAVTRYGFMATGRTHCPPGSGNSCTSKPIQYLSTDGLHWKPFASSVGNVVIVDGPAGVIALSDPGSAVWRLRP